jgi:hypothetical protein
MKDFVNLDVDNGDDLWSLDEVAKAVHPIAFPGGNAYYYGTKLKLTELIADESIETPAPTMLFKGTVYWPASDEVANAFAEAITAERKRAEEMAYTKVAMLEALYKQAGCEYERTKRGNRDLAIKYEHTLDFIQALGGAQVSNNLVEKIREAIRRWEAEGR